MSGAVANEGLCNGYPAGTYTSEGFALGGACRAAIYSQPFRLPAAGGR